MRQFKFIAVGKIKQAAKYLEAGIALYQKRVERHAKIQWIEVPEETPTPTCPVSEVLSREADRILKHCDPDAMVILMSERGTLLDSPAFAERFFSRNPLNGGDGHEASTAIIFIIGGAYGVSPKLSDRAGFTWSLSPLTFPHQMVRLVLMEQLYRAFTIINNEPYHK